MTVLAAACIECPWRGRLDVEPAPAVLPTIVWCPECRRFTAIAELEEPVYPNLEPNHVVALDDDGFRIVVCPLTNPQTGQAFRTRWGRSAKDEEIECLFCEWASGRRPELAGYPDDHDPDEDEA